jgi:arsenate reductase (thioredoxin)
MDKIKILFVCVHNSARSQMAEAFLKQLAGDSFDVESAGIEPGSLNPIVVDAMKEIGIDISGNLTKSAFDIFTQGRQFNYIITVCDAASGERCPVFPGLTKRLGWYFEDPASFSGTSEEKLAHTRIVRDTIKSEVENFIKTYHLVNF